MGLIFRQITDQDTLGSHLALGALVRVIPPACIAAVFGACGAPAVRSRTLPALVTLVCSIAMNLYTTDDLAHVFRRLVAGLRWRWPNPANLRVSKGALCPARDRRRARPRALLCRRVCQPRATMATPEACRFGLRLLAVDGTTRAVPDTPANVQAFGRQRRPRGRWAWPRRQLVALSACGTHAIGDAGSWRWDADERTAGRRLLRSVGRGMLLLWGRGFHRCTTSTATRARSVQYLGRLPATDKPMPLRTRSAGTPLVQLRPGDYRRRRGEIAFVRLIRSTLDDPGRPGHGEEHRLVTALLNPRHAPAEELVLAYHPRWEFAVAADEVKTQQRPVVPLRSRKPVGVIQEVYALLLAHYLVRAVLVEAARTVARAPTRLSCLTTLRLIRAALPAFQRAAPVEHPRLYQQLLADIVVARLPAPANRRNPRVVKKKMSNFKVKGPPQQSWPQPTQPCRAAIVLLI